MTSIVTWQPATDVDDAYSLENWTERPYPIEDGED
jgi:hypothetical protein